VQTVGVEIQLKLYMSRGDVYCDSVTSMFDCVVALMRET
jgi:hypothetical protein